MSGDKQLLKYLKAAKTAPGGGGDAGRTVKELAVEIFGFDTKCNRAKVWDRLGPEIDAGRVVAGRGMRLNRAAMWHGEPVFRVVSQ